VGQRAHQLAVGQENRLAGEPAGLILRRQRRAPIDRIFDAIQAGASGYLLKDEPIDTVVAAIRDMHAGGAPMSAPIAKKVLGLMRLAVPANPRDPAESDLTDREAQILKELATGKTTAAIGEALFLSPLTVKTHIKNIYRKLHVSSRAEATRLAMKRNLV
jgi:DNA-binding NarL/FixJ family response regulator